ncbi:MAG: 5'-methylthioadenosine/S-adenosylhomocysteine nucleosidase [Rhodobacterales bacterium]|nr:MAG: 5'-methylthioadenosine/S-adenosylhomocysteine nucleosidase [Rhodobacterales bacterium]
MMAADAEYGPNLRARITPLMTGVGPAEAGVVAAGALARLELTENRPDLVICLGSAGSARLDQGAVYQVSSVSYRDMDASPLGFPKGVTPLSDLPPEIALPQVPGLPAGRLATGASVVSGDAYRGIDADMVDMETWAILRACQQHDLPLIGLRGISDGAAPLKGITCWTDLLPVLDAHLATALDTVAGALQADQIAL